MGNLISEIKVFFSKENIKAKWDNMIKPILKRHLRKMVKKYIYPSLQEYLSVKVCEKVVIVIEDAIESL